MTSMTSSDPDPTPSGFERNLELEALLGRINGLLAAGEESLPPPPPLKFPLVLLVAAPRSGTTLFMQWLSSCGLAVPTNLISRFYAVPAFGAMLQKLLFDPRYRFRDEFDLQARATDFASDLGKTSGLSNQNVFLYFWREFFPLQDPARLPVETLERIDVDRLRRSIRRFAAEFDVPLAMKGYLVQYHLEFLDRCLDRVLFVHLTRDPLATAASILEARRRRYGGEERWWGCRPPGCEALYSRDPAVQAVGQVLLTDRSIRAELAALPPGKQLAVSYEQLCSAPAAVWTQLRDKIVALSAASEDAAESVGKRYPGPGSFRRSERAVATERLERARAEVDALCGER